MNGDSPCGKNEEDSPEFAQLEQLIESGLRYESELSDGEWAKGVTLAKSLLEKTRDVRVALWLTRCEVQLRGFSGLSAGLDLVVRYVSDYDPLQLHPVLEAEDDFPEACYLAIGELAKFESFLGAIQKIPVVEVKGLGRFSYRDWLLATGVTKALSSEDESVESESTIIAAFDNADQEHLLSIFNSIESAKNLSISLDKVLTDGEYGYRSPDLSGLKDLLLGIEKVFLANSVVLEKRDLEMVSAVDLVEDSNVLEKQSEPKTANPIQRSGDVMTSEFKINSRVEAERAIDLICEYFKRSEPSSPVPLLLVRAKSLLNKDFAEILAEFAPSGLSDIENFRSASQSKD